MKKIVCALRLLIAQLKCSFDKSGVWACMLRYAVSRKSAISLSQYSCLVKWLYIRARNEKSPEMMVSLYKEILQNTPLPLKERAIIAIAESSLWLREDDVFLNISRNFDGLPEKVSSRLQCLYGIRITKDITSFCDSLTLSSGYVFLDYLDDFSKALLADRRDNTGDALLYYERALNSLPVESEEYAYARERCNLILTAQYHEQ